MGLLRWMPTFEPKDSRPAPARAPEPDPLALAGNAAVQAQLGLEPIDAPDGVGGGGAPSFLGLHPPGPTRADLAYGATTVRSGRGFARAAPDGVSAGAHRRTADGGTALEALGFVPGGAVFTRRRAAADGLDEDGEVGRGHEQRLRVGPDGVQGAARWGVGGDKVDVGASVGADGVSVSGGVTRASGWGVGGSVGYGDGRVDASVGVKGPGGGSLSFSGHSLDRRGDGGGSNPVLDGRTLEVSHTVGSGFGGAVGVDTAWVGASFGGGASTRDRVAFQRSEAAVAREFDPSLLFRRAPEVTAWGDPTAGLLPPMTWDGVAASADWRSRYLQARYGGRLEGLRSAADLDVDSLAPGDGLTWQHDRDEHLEASGRVAVVSAGYGDRDLSSTRTAIARTPTGFRVSLETADTDHDLADVGLGSLLGFASDESRGRSRSAEFEVADDAAGRAALHDFLQTGALPGAAAHASPFDRLAYDQARRWVAALEARGDATPEELERARSAVFAASGRMNGAALDHGPELLRDGGPATYAHVGSGGHRGDASTLAVGGFPVLHGGSDESWYERLRRGAAGPEVEAGYSRSEDWWLDPDETTSITVNPEEAPRAGSEHARITLSSLQSTNAGHRRLLDEVGAAGMDPVMRRAWAEGQVHDGDRARIALALTDAQLDTIRTRLGPAAEDFGGLRGDARASAGPLGWVGHTFELPRGADPDGVIDRVRSAEDFDALPLAEKRFFLDAAARGAQYRGEWKHATGRGEANPWRTLPLALRSEDPAERDALVRLLFESVEASSLNSTCAITQLVAFVEQDGAVAGLPPDERRALLSHLSVAVDDGRVNRRTERLEKKLQVSRGDAVGDVANGLLADRHRALTPDDRRYDWERRGGLLTKEHQRPEDVEANRGDALVDWLLAAERAGGPSLVAEAVAEAETRDPDLVAELLSDARHEPWRREVAVHVLTRAGVLQPTP